MRKQTTLAEARKQFVAEALTAEKSMQRSGKGYFAAEIHRFMAAKVLGKKVRRPQIKSWR